MRWEKLFLSFPGSGISITPYKIKEGKSRLIVGVLFLKRCLQSST